VAPHPVSVDLSPAAVEHVAARVAQLLAKGQDAKPSEVLTAGELALRLRVERPWVYRHRRLLGGFRLGSGPKAQWRFDYETAVERLRRLDDKRFGENTDVG
jgi:hypothetical protein